MVPYNDRDYAENRLMGTIAMANGEPVYVHRIEDGEWLVERLVDRIKTSVKYNDLDINPVSLGYVNAEWGVEYISRIPKRNDWRQGLRDNNTYCANGNVLGNIPYVDLRKCIIGDYPNLAKARLMSVKRDKPVAFHRYWCVHKDEIYHKSKSVGKFFDGRVVLTPKYMYLEDKLMECLDEKD